MCCAASSCCFQICRSILNAGADAQQAHDRSSVDALCQSIVFEGVHLWIPSHSERCIRLKDLVAAQRDAFEEVLFCAICRRVQSDEEAVLRLGGGVSDSQCLLEVFEVFLDVSVKDAIALVDDRVAGAADSDAGTNAKKSITVVTLEVLLRNLLSWILWNIQGKGNQASASQYPLLVRLTSIITAHIDHAATVLVEKLSKLPTTRDVGTALARLHTSALRSVPLNFVVCSRELLKVLVKHTYGAACVHKCLASTTLSPLASLLAHSSVPCTVSMLWCFVICGAKCMVDAQLNFTHQLTDRFVVFLCNIYRVCLIIVF